jgi:hypothetical protein
MTPTLSTEPLTERLWTAADGTFCLLATGNAPPSYTISLRRGAEVLEERRLYGLASAQMLAQGWRDAGPVKSEALTRAGRSKKSADRALTARG